MIFQSEIRTGLGIGRPEPVRGQTCGMGDDVIAGLQPGEYLGERRVGRAQRDWLPLPVIAARVGNRDRRERLVTEPSSRLERDARHLVPSRYNELQFSRQARPELGKAAGLDTHVGVIAANVRERPLGK